MADDEDVIYIDVAPRLDDGETEKVTDRLKDRFKGVGKAIGEVLDDDLKQELRGRLEDTAKEYSAKFGRAIGEGIHDMAKDVGIDIEGITGQVQDAVEKFQNVKGAVDEVTGAVKGVGDAVKAVKSGDGGIDGVKTALDGLEEPAKKVGIDISDWKKPLDDAHGQTKNIQEAVHSVGDIFTAMPGKIGAMSMAMMAFVDGPLAIALTTALAIDSALNIDSNTYDPGQHGWLHTLFGKVPDWLGLTDPSNDLDKHNLQPPTPKLAGPGSDGPITPQDRTGQMILGSGGAGLSSWIQQGEAAAGVDSSWTPGLQTLIGRESSGNPSAINLVDSNAKAGHPSQGLMQLIPGNFSTFHVPGTSNSITDPVANIAAGIKYIQATYPGGLAGVQQANPNMPPKGYAGGGVLPGDSPGYDNMLGSLGGSPIGLEGGEFVVNPGATKANLGLLQAINGGMLGFDSGGQVPSPSPFLPQFLGDLSKGNVQGQKPAGVAGQSPDGVQGQKPSGVLPDASKPATAPDAPSPPQTIIPQGKGKGFSLQGGALGSVEGAANQAGAMALDAMAPGSGEAASAAMQIAEQEANRAIQFGVQAGTTLAIEAPLDTFWMSGSGLSDPSHSWFGKLGLSMIGQHGSVQNLAGQTQAPLTPGQGQQSPLGGKPQGQQSPSIHIENQYNNSDVDHEGNNRSLVNQMNAYSPAY